MKKKDGPFPAFYPSPLPGSPICHCHRESFVQGERERRRRKREGERVQRATDLRWWFNIWYFDITMVQKLIRIMYYMRYSTLYCKIGFVIPLARLALLGHFRVLCRTPMQSSPTPEARVLAGTVIGHGCSWGTLIPQHIQPDTGGAAPAPQHTYIIHTCIRTYIHTYEYIHT